LGEPLPVCGYFQPERPIILPVAIGRQFAGLFGMPAVFFGRGHQVETLKGREDAAVVTVEKSEPPAATAVVRNR
jgi:hypothetical protein